MNTSFACTLYMRYLFRIQQLHLTFLRPFALFSIFFKICGNEIQLEFLIYHYFILLSYYLKTVNFLSVFNHKIFRNDFCSSSFLMIAKTSINRILSIRYTCERISTVINFNQVFYDKRVFKLIKLTFPCQFIDHFCIKTC